MTRPLVNFADAERAVIDYLTAHLSETVGAFYPRSSTDSPAVPFVQVAWDGTPTVLYPITQRATVRVTAWAATPTAAKALHAKAQGLLLTHPGDGAVWAVQALTGGLPARDTDTGLFLTSSTYRVSVRPSVVA